MTTSEKQEPFNPFDPTGMFKDIRYGTLDAWSKMMVQMVNTDVYAQATGAILDAWTSTSVPFRKAMETVMTQVLANLSMPNRNDIISLGERLTSIEMRLDDLEAKLDERRQGPSKASAGSKAKPAAGEK
jgi:hypothetical protein